MKKIMLMALLAGWTLGLSAQSLNKVKDMLNDKELDKAKTGIDALLANPKNQKNAEVWYIKAKIYGAIAANDQFKTLVADGRVDAYEAIKKASELDKTKTTTFLTVDSYKPVYDLYGSYFDIAASQYNAEKYEDALVNFNKSGEIGNYIFEQGWGLYKLDTTLTYYSALSAMNAKKDDEAVTLFQKLADAKVGAKPEYVTTYRYLAKHYLDKKDIPNMQKYVALGRELYPKDEYLPLVEFDYIRSQSKETGDKKPLYAKYEELIAGNPEGFDMIVDYANELFNETHVSDAKERPADYAERCIKIEALYTRALAIKPEALEVNLNLAKHYFNQALFIEDEVKAIKGTLPEDVKKKDELKAKVLALCDKAIPPFEVVFKKYDSMETLKLSEKSEYKSACNNLAYCYDRKKDKAKSDFYQKKYDEADKK